MALIQKELKVRIKFLEEVLGMSPNSQEVYGDFIASKAPNAPSAEEEIAAVGVVEYADKQRTVFPRDKNGNPFIWNYQMKGLFKDACGMLNRLTIKEKEEGKKTAVKKPQNESGKLTSYKKVIDGLIFVAPRMIPIILPKTEQEENVIGVCERPLRAQTAQGERIALASSETIPAGSVIEFTVQLLDPSLEPVIREWLDYGALRGFGQWRNSGKGIFEYEILDD